MQAYAETHTKKNRKEINMDSIISKLNNKIENLEHAYAETQNKYFEPRIENARDALNDLQGKTSLTQLSSATRKTLRDMEAVSFADIDEIVHANIYKTEKRSI